MIHATINANEIKATTKFFVLGSKDQLLGVWKVKKLKTPAPVEVEKPEITHTSCYEEMGQKTNATLQYSCSYGGGYYVATFEELKGRGIRKTGDGSNRKDLRKSYHVTDRALQILKKSFSTCYMGSL